MREREGSKKSLEQKNEDLTKKAKGLRTGLIIAGVALVGVLIWAFAT